MTDKVYKIIESSSDSTFIEATDASGKKFAIPTDPSNSDYAQYLASLEATPTKTTKTTVVEEPVAPEEE
jgi:hypothetical protein